jgi:hypothetical protein
MPTCPEMAAVPGTGALKLKKSATPGCVTMPVPVPVAVLPDTTVISGVAVARLLPLRGGAYASLLDSIAVSFSCCTCGSSRAG